MTAFDKFQSTPSARRATDWFFTVDNKTELFQSTPSARRATRRFRETVKSGEISIHALREESDGSPVPCRSRRSYFNPRPPRGERLVLHTHVLGIAEISIHALREESDETLDAVELLFDISIHALREESDRRRRRAGRP